MHKQKKLLLARNIFVLVIIIAFGIIILGEKSSVLLIPKAEEKFNEFIRSKRPESNQEFTFGNTQKLINMTVKYIYISAYVQRCEEFRNLFADCHCPLDRRMAAVVGKEFDETDDEAAQVIKEESSDIYKKINKDITWSKVDKETYNCYQQMVRLLAEKKNLIPIEYDFVKWGTSKS